MSISTRVPLTVKMMTITLLAGFATWGLLDPVHRSTMKKTFGVQLEERLERESYENRMLFDGYVNRFMYSPRILLSQRQFFDYVRTRRAEWSSPLSGPVPITYHTDPPPWLPASTVIRTLPDFHFAVLLDHNGMVREIFTNYPETPPRQLLNPGGLLLQMSHQQVFMTDFDGIPYVAASEMLADDSGTMLAALLVAGALDNEFIRESMGSMYSKNLVALVGTDTPVILASSRPDLLKPGLELGGFENDYIYTGSSFFDYGSSDLHIQFVTLLPKRPYEELSASILQKERMNRIVTAVMLILSFSVLMFWVTRRIQNVTRKVKDFSEMKLKFNQPQIQKGDEIDVLERRLRTLSEEVLASHEAIGKQARLLRLERDRAQNYLDIAASILLVLDTAQNVRMINRRGCEILGYKEEALIGKNWFDTVLEPHAVGEGKEHFQHLITGNTGLHIYHESPVMTQSGERRIIGWHNTLLKDETGRINGILSSGEDITARKDAEEKLKKAYDELEMRVQERTEELEKTNKSLTLEISERKQTEEALQKEKEKLQKYLDISAAIVVMIGPDQTVTLINKKGCEILGCPEDEIIGKNWFDTFLPERLREDVKAVFSQLMAGTIEPVEYYENAVLTKNGEERTIAWYNTVFRDDAGSIVATLGTGGDITEHKKIETALRISEERFRGAFESAAIGIGLVSPEGRWLRVNSALCSIVGYSEEELLSLTFQDITHPDDLEADLALVRQVLAGERSSYHMEKRYIHKGGYVVWILLSVSLVRNEQGAPLHFVSQIQDITERKEAEKRLMESLREKEVLLKEIHHRVKNNMTVISSLLKLQADKVQDEHYRELFNESTNRIRTMALIHDQLYRSGNLAKIVFSDYLGDMADNVYSSYGTDATVRLHKRIEPVTLSLDTAIPCGLIVNELLVNSLKYAFPDGRSGDITLSLKNMNGDVELTVSDNGAGLPGDFDLQSNGSLGLSIVHALARQIRARIEIIRDRGTEFRITFRNAP